MKLLLLGATGYIGAEILRHAIAHNYITHILCLTRHPLPEKLSSHPKVSQILHTDFSQYPDHILSQLADFLPEACIFALGRPRMTDYKSKEEAERVGIHYPITAAGAFASALATKLDPNPPPRKQKFPFRFIFISAWGAEQDQDRSLWMWAESRKIKGAAEKGIFHIADHCELLDGKKCFEAVALRAGGVIAGGDSISTIVSEAVMPYIAVDQLAKCALREVLGTGSGKRILENAECLGEDWAQINSLTI